MSDSDEIDAQRRSPGEDALGTERPPLVLRIIGPALGGKTTLLLRTAAILRDCTVRLVDANHPDDAARRAPPAEAGSPVTRVPAAHWRKGFRDAVEHLAPVDVILVEDRDQPPSAGIGLGEDVQVMVVPASDIASIRMPSLVDAQVVLLTKPDQATGFDAADARTRLRRANSKAAVFVVGPGDGDPGLDAWRQWLEARLRQHRR